MIESVHAPIQRNTPYLGGPPQYFEFFQHAQKINFTVYNASMECKLIVKTILWKKT